MLSGTHAAGFNVIEMLIGLAILGLVMMIGLPNLATWIQNTQIRTSAEAMQAGLQLARAEALKRNVVVRFQLVSTLTSSCALSASGKSWVVSLADPSGACNTEPSETAAPQIIQKRDGNEGSANATVAATGGSVVQFNGLGRVTGANPITQINVGNQHGDCKTAGGPMRCLRVNVDSGGRIRMCDPAFDVPGDPRNC